MLSYRHAFHAGNFADCFKHAVLTLLLLALAKKAKPMFVLDTHAGQGVYDLGAPWAQKNREYEGGIARLWRRADAPESLAPWLVAVRAENPELAEGAEPRWYPGSAALIRGLLRPGDRLVLTELQQDECAALAARFRDDRRVRVERRDGYEALKAFLPPRERRGLVLIDPAYELADEWERIVAALVEAHRRWPTGVYALWYPIQHRRRAARLHEDIKATGIRDVLAAELCILPADVERRLNGSGMIIVNPPWGLDEQLRAVLPWLHAALDVSGQGAQRVARLAPE